MSWVATAVLGAGALGAGASIYGANKAASAQSTAANNALGLQSSMFGQAQQNFNTVQQANQPFINAGQSFLPTLQSLLKPGANLTDVLSQMPGFQFANTYGQKAITNQATMGGLSGNALTAGANYATGLASNTYSGIVSQLLAGAGLGTTGVSNLGNAANTFTNAAANFGQSGGNLITGAGNAAAGAAIGTGNAIGGLGSSIGNLALLQSLSGNKGGGLFGGGNQPNQPNQPIPGPNSNGPY
jgi:hypothetical protein